MTYREPTKKPCSDCPFRKRAMPGWLGASSPEGFIDCINRDDVLPCHQTIDYTDPAWKEKWIAQADGNVCAGALIMSANMCKHPRDPEFPTMPRDRETVFANPMDFVRYHRESMTHSWVDSDQSDEAKYLRSVFERAAHKIGHPFAKHQPKRERTKRRKGSRP